MIREIFTKYKSAFAVLFVLALSIFASAQPESFRVGETVETGDGRVCKILSLTGRSAKVACGANRSDVRVYSFDALTSEAQAQAKRAEQERQRQNPINPQRPAPTSFSPGDAVQTPNGRTGVIESLEGEVAKIKIGGEFDFIAVQDLKKIETAPTRTFRVGDQVVSGSATGVIESLSPDGKGAKVRYGNGKYDFKWEAFVNLRTPEEGRRDAEQEKMWKVFRVEARPFFNTVQLLEQYYNPNAMDMKATGLDDEGRKNAAIELAELDRICRTKYPNIENERPINPAAEVLLHERYGDQCAIARERDSILQKAKMRFLALDAEQETGSWMIDLNRLSGENGYEVSDKVQTLIFDRAGWEKKNIEYIKKKYAAAGETMPPDTFAVLYKKADELKAKIEADAPTRSWVQPKFKDVALEALARREVPGDFPGAKVFKTGMDYTTWESRDTTTYIGSDRSFRFYRITPGAYRFKRGVVLVQLPNRPFCQIREFQVTQYKAGAGYGAAKASGSDTGKFVSCQ